MNKRIRMLNFLSMILISSGCNSSIALTLEAPIRQISENKSFIYNPKGKEEFIFSVLPEEIQVYGYEGVCKQIPSEPRDLMYGCKDNRLKYTDYVGKRGFYTGLNTKNGKSNYYLRQAILETGESYYLVFSYSNSFISSHFQPYDEYLLRHNFQPYPIVEGSDIYVRKIDKKYIDLFLVGENPARLLSSQEILNIQDIANMYAEKKSEIAEVLFNVNIKKDEFDEVYKIEQLHDSIIKTKISLSLNLSFQGELTAKLNVSYSGSDLLFIDNYSVNVDGKIWDSGKVSFNQDYDSEKVWEWTSSPINNRTKKLLIDISKSEKATVRFRGIYYKHDFVISQKSKKSIENLIFLMETFE